MRSTESNPYLLVNPGLGFTADYLAQLHNRMCRCGVSASGEAATIILTFPDADAAMSEIKLSVHLLNGVFELLRLREGRSDFDMDCPVPEKDA